VSDIELIGLMRVAGDALDLRTVGMDVLRRVGGRGEAEVIVQQGSSAVTRFANSFIHQNVADDWQRVRLKVVTEGRLATGVTNRLDAGSLDRLVEDTLLAATYRPVDPDWPGLCPPEAWLTVDDDHYDKDTHAADPAARAEVVKAFVDAGPELEAAGFCSTDGWTTFFANTDDHRAEGQASLATIEAIHRTAPAEDGWRADGRGWQSSSRLGDLDGAAAGRVAAEKARAGAGAVDLEPGSYEVVLEPAAVADVVEFLAQGFDAKTYREGRSFVRAKKLQFDPDISIWDDALDPRAIGVSFDAEGTPKAAVDLVLEGVSNALVHDRRTAAKAKVRSTGHAVEGGETWGPMPSNLFLGEGDRSPGDLVASVRRGLLVTEFWYTRTLDPKTMVVTGLTRNGTFLIEDGAVVGPVRNLRFTQSYVDALAPGNVLGVGDDPRLYGSSCVVPTLHLASWNFTGGARG
jgi:predicted Zn-dependent protease